MAGCGSVRATPPGSLVPPPVSQLRRGMSSRAARARRLLLRAGILFAVAALTVLAAGCGGGGSANGGAPTTAGSSSAPTAGSGSSTTANSTRQVRFSLCMRTHGEPSFPDPINGKLTLTITKGGPLDPNSPQFQSALQACKSLAPPQLTGTSTQSTVSMNQIVKFAHCMRTNGVTNFPDPTQNGGFLMSGNIQNNPHFQSALQACRTLLPGATATAP